MNRHVARTMGAAALFGLAQACVAAVAHENTPHGSLVGESESSAPADDAYQAPPPYTLGGPFELMDHTGRIVTDEDFRGSWMLIFFGYPGCRESCPIALLTMDLALEALGADADRIQPIFIDFSMEEPDIVGLAQFVGNFHPRLIGLTGTRAQTFDVVREFKVIRQYQMANYSQTETGPRIDHTTYFYLVDPEGTTRAYYHHDRTAAELAADIQQHLEQ